MAMNPALEKERNPKKPLSLAGLLLFGLPPFAVAALGGIFTSSSVDSEWYRALEKPSWNPPSWVFGPVWTVLYLAMGVAAWRVWLTKERQGGLTLPLSLWVGQLALNLGWTFAFFQQRSPLAGVVVIVLLWVAIAATILAFAPKSKLAALLMSPYLAWVSFAMALNVAIWQMN